MISVESRPQIAVVGIGAGLAVPTFANTVRHLGLGDAVNVDIFEADPAPHSREQGRGSIALRAVGGLAVLNELDLELPVTLPASQFTFTDSDGREVLTVPTEGDVRTPRSTLRDLLLRDV